MKPQKWITIPLPKPHELPGYAEAVAMLERGESLFPETVKQTRPRTRRTLEELTAERDRLIAQRDRLTGAPLPDDPGAWSGVSRRPNPKRWATIDRQLAEYTRLTSRIDALTGRIRGMGGGS